MINRIHGRLHRPERGWDPVGQSYAKAYAEKVEWEATSGVVDRVEALAGSLAGKTVLDLGGGPGQYSIAFAQRGADVTWHDISRAYLEIARERAARAEVRVRFSLGYLEEASNLGADLFDLVFNRICWYYGVSDRGFAGLIYGLVKPGGAAYIDSSVGEVTQGSGLRRLQHLLNDRFWIKIGHPHPPHGRVAGLFRRYPLERMVVDYSSPRNDRVFFVKAKKPLS